MADEERTQEEAEKQFKGMATDTPGRKVDLDDDNVMPERRGKTLADAESEEGAPTDLIATLRRLFPTFEENCLNRNCKAVMVGRVMPDSMFDRIYLTATSVIDDWDEDLDGVPNFDYVLNTLTTAFEIGLDSKGREDAIQLHGVARETEQLEKLANRIEG